VPSFTELGYNYRLSDIQAAIMRVQLRRMSSLLESRTRAASSYEELLGDLEQIQLPASLDDRTHTWQSFVIAVAPDLDRGKVALELRSRGVGCNFGTYASHVQPLYGEQPELPVSADLFARHLAIPMHANLSEEDLDHVASAVREVVSSASVRA
jgi:dTDP-4-amino-4,6-dideoxygalactose transaminase